jgi:hypothetical protein
MACKEIILTIYILLAYLTAQSKNLEDHGSVLGRSGKLLCDTMPQPASGFTKVSLHKYRELFPGGKEKAV